MRDISYLVYDLVELVSLPYRIRCVHTRVISRHESVNSRRGRVSRAEIGRLDLFVDVVGQGTVVPFLPSPFLKYRGSTEGWTISAAGSKSRWGRAKPSRCIHRARRGAAV